MYVCFNQYIIAIENYVSAENTHFDFEIITNAILNVY